MERVPPRIECYTMYLSRTYPIEWIYIFWFFYNIASDPLGTDYVLHKGVTLQSGWSSFACFVVSISYLLPQERYVAQGWVLYGVWGMYYNTRYIYRDAL